jgi:hypothetical protein
MDMYDDNLDDFEQWLKEKEFRSLNVTAVGFGVEKVRDAVLALANVMRARLAESDKQIALLTERLQKLEDTK